jgi:hypothetical protein
MISIVSHAIHCITGFNIVGPYTLHIGFADGSQRTIDFQPVLRGKMYGPLLELEFFNSVRLDPEVHTLIWPNGADFDPATLHDWLRVAPALIEQAQSWTSQPQPNTR